MFRVSLMNINGLRDPKIFQEKVKLVDKDRNMKIAGLHQEDDRIRSLGAGLLLKNVLTANHLDGEIIYGKQGKPYLKNNKEYFFNLSHSGDYAVCALADFEIGIDIQIQKPMNFKICDRFFTRDEKEFIMKEAEFIEREKNFYTIWTRKESYMKYTGLGMKQDIRNISVLACKEACFVDYDDVGGYSIAICMKKVIFKPNINYYHI